METLTIFVEKIDLQPELISVEYTAITEEKQIKEIIKYKCNQNFKERLKSKYNGVNININEDNNLLRLCMIEKVYNSINEFVGVIIRDEVENNKDWVTINDNIKMFHLGAFTAVEILGISKITDKNK